MLVPEPLNLPLVWQIFPLVMVQDKNIVHHDAAPGRQTAILHATDASEYGNSLATPPPLDLLPLRLA